MRSLQASDDTSPARKEKEEGEGDERGPSESAPRAVSGAEETIAANRKGQQSEASRSAAATADSPPLSAADDPGRNQSALPTREEERSETSSDGEEGDFTEQCRRNKKKKSVGTTPLLPSPTSGKRNSVNSLHAHARRSETSTTILFSPCRHGKSFRGVSRFDVGEELKHHAGLKAIRINMRLNIAAVDCEKADSCSALLELRSLCGVQVQPCVARDGGHAHAVLRGIDLNGDARSIIARIKKDVPILEGIKRGRLLFLTFQGPPAARARVPVARSRARGSVN